MYSALNLAAYSSSCVRTEKAPINGMCVEITECVTSCFSPLSQGPPGAGAQLAGAQLAAAQQAAAQHLAQMAAAAQQGAAQQAAAKQGAAAAQPPAGRT